MDNERYGTWDYAKLFLLMIIPAYGFFFTLLLAFDKDVEGELKSFARGALIARVVFLLVVVMGAVLFFSLLFPEIKNFVNGNIGFLRLFR